MDNMGIEEFCQLASNYGFPVVLSLYLLIRLDHFFSEIVKNQKEYSEKNYQEMKEIRDGIKSLNVIYSQLKKD